LVQSTPNPSRPRTPLGSQHRLLSFVYLGSFLNDWANLGLSETDLEVLEKLIMNQPEVGVVIPGTAGLRKMRFASTKGNKGKSGSERVCYALFPARGIALMVAVYGKGKKDNLTAVERSAVKAMLTRYEAQLRS
jgi:hypothetical protein